MSTTLVSPPDQVGATYLVNISDTNTILYESQAPSPPAPPIYTWSVGTTYTFTNNFSIGPIPMGSLPNYSPAPFYPTYITMPQNGYQYLTIGNSGDYELTCYGAQGGRGASGTPGWGGTMIGTVSLSANDVLILCVGQIGLNSGPQFGSGGGGMTAIFLSSGGTGTPTPLLVAAGGGGTAGNGTSGSPPFNYDGFGPINSWDTESTPSTLQGNDATAGSATQASVATITGNPSFSYGLIDSSGTILSGNGSIPPPNTPGGWGGGGAGLQDGSGGGSGGWIGSPNTIPAMFMKSGGFSGTNFASNILSGVSYITNNNDTGKITIKRTL